MDKRHFFAAQRKESVVLIAPSALHFRRGWRIVLRNDEHSESWYDNHFKVSANHTPRKSNPRRGPPLALARPTSPATAVSGYIVDSVFHSVTTRLQIPSWLLFCSTTTLTVDVSGPDGLDIGGQDGFRRECFTSAGEWDSFPVEQTCEYSWTVLVERGGLRSYGRSPQGEPRGKDIR